MRYQLCTKPPSPNKTLEQFELWGDCSLYWVLHNANQLVNKSRYKIYQYDCVNRNVSVYDVKNYSVINTDSKVIRSLFEMYGWEAFSEEQQQDILDLIYCNYNDYLLPITKYLISNYDQYDRNFLYEKICVDLILFKYRHHLKDENHWICKASRRYGSHSYFINSSQVRKRNPIVGYKAFYVNPCTDKLECRNYEFDTIHPNIITGFIQPCHRGFHFCKQPSDIQRYYNLNNPSVVVFKVHGWGTVMDFQDKTVCSRIQLIEQIDKCRIRRGLI